MYRKQAQVEKDLEPIMKKRQLKWQSINDDDKFFLPRLMLFVSICTAMLVGMAGWMGGFSS